MIDAKLIRQVLDKFLKSETVKHARMQVRTSDGVYHDIKSVKLLENKIIGSRESHRIVMIRRHHKFFSLTRVFSEVRRLPFPSVSGC